MRWTTNAHFGVLVVNLFSVLGNDFDSSSGDSIELFLDFSTSESVSDSAEYYSNESGGCDKKLICYFTSWATYRTGGWNYTVDTMDASLCTHYIYAFAVLNNSTYKAVPADSWLDIDKNYFKKFCEKVKAAGAVPIIGVGGWTNSAGQAWEELFKDQKKQAQFIESVIELFEKYGFTGVELDYEYPGCPQGKCTDPESKNRFTGFVKRMHQAFQDKSWTISVAIPASDEKINYSYDLLALQENVDWFNVMCYDYFGTDEKVTYHHAPLRSQPKASKKLNVEYTVQYLLNSGVHPEAVILGMPLYGKGYTLKDPEQHTVGSPVAGPSKAGAVTQSAGTLAYFEICTNRRGGWKMETKYQRKYYGRWIYHGNQWVGYDGIPELRKKVNLIKERKLGGGMIWALDFDDFRGKCGRGKSPLTTFLSKQLLGDEVNNICRMTVED